MSSSDSCSCWEKYSILTSDSGVSWVRNSCSLTCLFVCVCVCVCVCAQSCPTLYDLLDYNQQAPLSVKFCRQEHRSGLPFPPHGIFLTQGLNVGLNHPALAVRLFTMMPLTNRLGNNGNSDRLYFLGLPNHCSWWLQS